MKAQAAQNKAEIATAEKLKNKLKDIKTSLAKTKNPEKKAALQAQLKLVNSVSKQLEKLKGAP